MLSRGDYALIWALFDAVRVSSVEAFDLAMESGRAVFRCGHRLVWRSSGEVSCHLYFVAQLGDVLSRRFCVQHIGAEIDAVRSDQCAGLLIHGDLSEEVDALQGSEHAAPPGNPLAKIKFATVPSENQSSSS